MIVHDDGILNRPKLLKVLPKCRFVNSGCQAPHEHLLGALRRLPEAILRAEARVVLFRNSFLRFNLLRARKP